MGETLKEVHEETEFDETKFTFLVTKIRIRNCISVEKIQNKVTHCNI